MSDDYLGTIATTAVLQVGGERSGTIDYPGDKDCFKLSLVQGQEYYFSARPDGLHLLALGIFDKNGVSVMPPGGVSMHQAGGVTVTTLNDLVATYTGNYFLLVGIGSGIITVGGYKVYANTSGAAPPPATRPPTYPPPPPPPPEPPPLPAQPEYEAWFAANTIAFKPEDREIAEGYITGKVLDKRSMPIDARLLAWDRLALTLGGTGRTYNQKEGRYAIYVPFIGVEYFVTARYGDELVKVKDRIAPVRAPNNYQLELAVDPYYCCDISWMIGTLPTPRTITFSTDGLKMYACTGDNVYIYEFELSTAFDPSTAVLLGYVVWDSPGSDAAPFENGNGAGIAFSWDGSTAYLWDDDNRTLYQYGLSAAWDLSTLFYQGRLMESSGYLSTFTVAVSTTGNKVHLLSRYQHGIRQHHLEVPWQLPQTEPSIYYQSGEHAFYPSIQNNPQVFLFTPTGSTLIVNQPAANGGLLLNSIPLSVPWDLRTVISENGYTYLFLRGDSNPCAWLDGGMTMLFSSGLRFTKLQLQAPYDVSSASVAGLKFLEKAVASSGPMCWKDDGTIMIIAVDGFNRLDQYALSVPWDISTAVPVHSCDLSSYYATGVFVRQDGAVIYVVTGSNNDIYTLTMPIPWDVSSITGTSSFRLTAIGGGIRGMSFSDDGAVLSLCYRLNGREMAASLDCSTPWVVSSAVLRESADIQEILDGYYIYSAGFTRDGTWLVVLTSAYFFFFQLLTPFDAATAVFHKRRNDSILTGFYLPSFSPDGLQIYVNHSFIIEQLEIPAV